MKSIISALNAIANSIDNLTKAIQNKNNKYYNYSPQTTTTTTSGYNPYSYARITVKEEQAIKAIYSAMTDKGAYPEHHDHVVRELQTKWPVLYKALQELVSAKNTHYNTITRQKAKEDLWKKQNLS